MKKLNLLILFFIINVDQVKTLDVTPQPSPFCDQRECKNSKHCIPKFIIMHFTANCGYQESWKTFFNFLRPVSAHYIIGVDGRVAQMVPESKRAWHAGDSSWQKNENMNSASIGIELINPGFSLPGKNPCTINKKIWNKNSGKHVSGSDDMWYEFTSEQIESLIKLCKQIIERYKIPACNILGHSDIAPGRKVDPGPLFPWKKLAEHGVGLWWKDLQPCQKWDITDLQTKLEKFGYKIEITGQKDAQTTKVIQAFQMHFQQNDISGISNDQTLKILNSLLNQKFQEFDK